MLHTGQARSIPYTYTYVWEIFQLPMLPLICSGFVGNCARGNQ